MIVLSKFRAMTWNNKFKGSDVNKNDNNNITGVDNMKDMDTLFLWKRKTTKCMHT